MAAMLSAQANKAISGSAAGMGGWRYREGENLREGCLLERGWEAGEGIRDTKLEGRPREGEGSGEGRRPRGLGRDLQRQVWGPS